MEVAAKVYCFTAEFLDYGVGDGRIVWSQLSVINHETFEGATEEKDVVTLCLVCHERCGGILSFSSFQVLELARI
jgi:predicted CoA-binding protein